MIITQISCSLDLFTTYKQGGEQIETHFHKIAPTYRKRDAGMNNGKTYDLIIISLPCLSIAKCVLHISIASISPDIELVCGGKEHEQDF